MNLETLLARLLNRGLHPKAPRLVTYPDKTRRLERPIVRPAAPRPLSGQHGRSNRKPWQTASKGGYGRLVAHKPIDKPANRLRKAGFAIRTEATSQRGPL
jgi:hypothetical protein